MIGLLLGKLKVWAIIAAAGAVAVLVFLIRKSGGDAERLKQAQADLKANAEIQKSRNAARNASDSELDKEVDRWTRP